MNYYRQANLKEGLATLASVSQTISETELFAHFAEQIIEKNMTISSAKVQCINSYRPADCLTDPGIYGELEDFSDTVYHRLLSSDDQDASLCFERTHLVVTR